MSGGDSLPGGAEQFPDHINDAHIQMVGDALDLIDETSSANPYMVAYSYDPTDDLSLVGTELDNLENLVEAATDGSKDWDDIVDTVTGKVDSLLYGSVASDIDAAENAFEIKHISNLSKASARLAAGFADINAVNTLGFWIAQSGLEADFAGDVGQHRSQLMREGYAQRAQLIAQCVPQMAQIISQGVDLRRLLFDATSKATAQTIIGQKEYLNEEIMLAERDAMWDLQTLLDGSTILGAVSGVPIVKTPMPAWASAMSSAMSAIGSVAPLAAASGNPWLGGAIILGAAALGGSSGAAQGT